MDRVRQITLRNTGRQIVGHGQGFANRADQPSSARKNDHNNHRQAHQNTGGVRSPFGHDFSLKGAHCLLLQLDKTALFGKVHLERRLVFAGHRL